MIELSAEEQALAAAQLAARPERRARSQSWAPVVDVNGGIGRIIAVASGKGGVGKSTVTANLAVLAARNGLKVGVLDADLHGYSLTRLLGIHDGATRAGENNAKVQPAEVHGVKAISIGMFTDPSKAVIWRGPVAHRALTQFLADTDWGELDVLLIDLPPGTGDIALSIANLLPTCEYLIVTTPQLTTAEVAARAGTMAKHTHQKVLGVVENLSWLIVPTGEAARIFGEGGGDAVATSLTTALEYDVPLLAQIPMDPQIPATADQGQPIVIAEPASPAAAALTALAANLGLTPVSQHPSATYLKTNQNSKVTTHV